MYIAENSCREILSKATKINNGIFGPGSPEKKQLKDCQDIRKVCVAGFPVLLSSLDITSLDQHDTDIPFV